MRSCLHLDTVIVINGMCNEHDDDETQLSVIVMDEKLININDWEQKKKKKKTIFLTLLIWPSHWKWTKGYGPV